ncbi:DsbA family protein [Actinomadura sp. NAK00032]|uniref:DsbA family oxidoreductase n=1 Tax=Actinomadura sp. NAK00032 TaxID=2742128 RepID=UPI0015905108|nr:DsbA family protein [Actinomadura sp. NAK00032]QKW38043.1 DsbA family protein [Actinomadura sp. NAK00032]
MKVEITHDIACVRSALGYARFRRAAEEHRAGGGDLEVVFRPYAGRPQRPQSADRIARAAAAEGLVMRLDRIVPADTFQAHRLIALAAVYGEAEDMAARLYRAYFTDGLDIADAGVLRSLASETGVPWRWPRDGERPVERGPRVPVFRFPDGTVLVGAVSLAALRNELRQAVRTAARLPAGWVAERTEHESAVRE